MPQIFDVNFVRIQTSDFVIGFMRLETAALARAYLGIGSGTGSVTNTGALTANQVVIGNGGVDIKVLASPGNATRFLNGAATPAFAQVKDSDLSTSDITTNNATSLKHGFLPKLSGNSAEFLDGSGAFSTPAGSSGTVTNTGSLTDHGVIVGNGGVDVSALSVGTNNTVLHGNTGADPTFSAVVEADITLADNTTNNVVSTRHGFAPKSPADATKFLNGDTTPAYALVKDSDLSTSDITTNNVSITKHGFAPKAPNDASKYLDGTGAYSTPAGGSSSPGGSDKNVQYNNAGSFGGIGNNATATKKYLQQVSSGTPSMEQVADADLSVTDVTTNNASTSAHGFLKKLPNDNTQYMDGTGNWSTPAGGGGTDPWYQWIEHSLIPTSQAATLNPLNVQNVTSANAFTTVAVTANNFQGLNLATSTAIDNIAASGSSSGAGGQFLIGIKGEWVGYVRPVSSTNARLFVGITALSTTNQTASDTPTGNYACFRYSTAAGDTNWKFVVGDNSSTEVFDTGVAINTTTMARLEIRWDGTASSSFTAYINGSLVATGTLNPASATTFHFSAALRVLANGTAKSFDLFGQKLRQKWGS